MAGSISGTSKSYFDTMQSVLTQIDHEPIEAYASEVFEAWRDDRQVLVFGNGGSAANASHHVADYVKTAAVDGQRRLRALCMSDNIGMLTALGNDVSYDDVFRYPLESYAKPGDLAVAITCSGNSGNLLTACEWARSNGVKVIALTGFQGGKIKDYADIHINIPSDNYGVIEDLQLSIGHIAAQILKSRILEQLAKEAA